MATPVFLSPLGNGWQFLDDNGVPLNGGFVNTYAAGTTTPSATFTSSLGTVQNANPIALNSAGRIATQVWIPAGVALKFVPVSSVSVAVGTAQDNIYGINDPTTINGIGYTGATISGALIMNSATINEAQGANIPVASQINLTTATGNYLSLTGTGTVTAVQLSQGAYRELVVNSASCAFVNSTTLAMLGGLSITPAVGDIIGFRGEGVSGVVRNVLYQRANGAPVAVFPVGSRQSALMAADVLMSNTANFFTGPTVSVGPIGVWYVSANAVCTDTSAVASFDYRLWDGATIISSGKVTSQSGGALVSLNLTGFISNPAGNIRLDVKDETTIAGVIKFNASTLSADGSIFVMRIA